MNHFPNLTYGTPSTFPSVMIASCNPKIEVDKTNTVGIAIIISMNVILALWSRLSLELSVFQLNASSKPKNQRKITYGVRASQTSLNESG
jgi:hypothetical protein